MLFFSFLFVRIFTFREANLAKRKRCMETRGCEKTGIAQGSGNWAKNRVWHWSVNVERSKGTCLEKKRKKIKIRGSPMELYLHRYIWAFCGWGNHPIFWGRLRHGDGSRGTMVTTLHGTGFSQWDLDTLFVMFEVAHHIQQSQQSPW